MRFFVARADAASPQGWRRHSPITFTSTRLPPPVKLHHKNLFPGTEVQLTIRDRDRFPPHQLPFDVRITIVLARYLL